MCHHGIPVCDEEILLSSLASDMMGDVDHQVPFQRLLTIQVSENPNFGHFFSFLTL